MVRGSRTLVDGLMETGECNNACPEITKKRGSQTEEQIMEGYGLAVILVICVIGRVVAENDYWIYNSNCSVV